MCIYYENNINNEYVQKKIQNTYYKKKKKGFNQVMLF